MSKKIKITRITDTTIEGELQGEKIMLPKKISESPLEVGKTYTIEISDEKESEDKKNLQAKEILNKLFGHG